MTKLRGRLTLVGATAAILAGCKRPSTPAATSSARDPLAGVDCAAVEPPALPDLRAWDASSRAQLDKLRRRGVVAVRYAARGCDVALELIPECVGPKDRYVYAPASATETTIAHSPAELFRQLPLGAPNVVSLLGSGRALRSDAVVVGTVGLPAGTTVTEYDLVGPECKRATHVIQTIYVGGFALAASDAKSASTTNVFTAPGPIEGATREGAAPICERARAEGIELPGCSAPIRLSLLPLGGRAAAPEPKPAVVPAPCSADDSDAGCVGPPPTEPRVFDQRSVERMVREKQGAVKRKCWEVAPESLRRVNVAVSGTIDPEGRVVDVQAQLLDSDGPPEAAASVSRCLAGALQTWVFPEPERPTPFTVPFHLIRQ